MATLYGANVVRDGLVLHLDASNVKSYPGSGTTWSDLSGNGNDAAFVNTPTYSSNNRGVFSVDGASDYFTTSYNVDQSGTFEYTFCAFAKLNSIASNRRHIISTDNGGFDWSLGSGDNNKFMAFSGNGVLGGANQDLLWHMHAAVWGNPTTYLYMDGNLMAQAATGFDVSNNPTYIAKNPGYNEYWNGNIGTVLIYNRALSEAEIKQNFNATRGRFGI